MRIQKISGGVTIPKGFKASCCAAGIKYKNRTDMAMIVSSAPCAVAGTFTTNKVKAAPVLWDMDVVYKNKSAQAVVVNAGIANAATGKTGLDICQKTADFAGATLGIPAGSVLLGSTGVIGPNLPLDRIQAGVKTMTGALSDTLEAGTAASKAIMTTDTVNKEFAVAFDLPAANGGAVTVHMGGMSKGSGMIHPNMCTMLCYLTTDLAISKHLLQKALSDVVTDTFNMISVDGDMSTNDTLILLANGLAGNPEITGENEDYAVFKKVLFSVCRFLAMQMAGDGEGAQHLIEAKVVHADTKDHAKTLAKSVIQSNLTKAAIFGRDANWGRVLCALGYSGAPFDPENVDLYFAAGDQKMLIFTNGSAADYSEEKAKKLLSNEAVTILADMHMGEEEAIAWGCDLTYDYVKINADYRS